MIAVWMLYASALSLCFGLAALALERAARLWAMPRRVVWAAAIVASLLVPVAGLMMPKAPVPLREPAPAPGSGGSLVVTPGPTGRAFSVRASSTPRRIGVVLMAMNGPLLLAWGVASLALALGLLRAAVRLRRRARGWRATVVDGAEVLVAPDMGPAVVRLGGLRVVLPEWALSAEPEARAMMLLHENEHREARDPDVLLGAALTLVLVPWAVPLWWHFRRLQLAVETDCDRRVMCAGVDAHAYGVLLLSVGARSTLQPLLAPTAFSEERSLLERRIEAMKSPSAKRRLMWTVLAMGVGALGVGAACVTPRPAAAPPQQPAPAATQLPAAAAAPISVMATRQQGEVYPLRALAREDRPTLLSYGPLRIPDSLHAIGGRVVVQWVIDTTGHPVPSSLRILSSSHPGFEAVVREQLMGSTWHPGRIDGRAVAVQFPPLPMEFPVVSGGAVVGFPAELSGRVPEPAAVPTAALPPGVYAEDAVTERPERLRSPAARYPDSLRTAGIGGRVLVEVIVDSTGHADSASVRILSSSHPGFEAPARDVVLGTTFAPGRLQGRAVPVMVRIPINFMTMGP